MRKNAGFLLGLAAFCLCSCEAKKTPVLASLSPDNGISTASDFVLIARGNELDEDCQVVFNGRVKETQFIGANELRCEITAADLEFVPETGLVKKVPVRIRSAEGDESNRLDFTIYGYPEFLPAVKIADSTTGYSDTIRPLLDLDEDGNVYAVWRDRAALYFSYSGDGGANWRLPVLVATGPAPPFLFAMAVQKATGTACVVWEDDDIIRFSRSSDSGQTWTLPQALTRATAWKASHPGISSDNGKIYVAYLNSNDSTDEYSVNVLVSRDGGTSFSAAGQIDWLMRFIGPNVPEVRADGNGLLYLVFPSDLNTKYSTNYLAFSQDGGVSWSEPQMISLNLPDLAIDDENGLNIIGSNPVTPSSYQLQFKRTVDRGATWASTDFADTGYSVSSVWVNPLGGTDVIWKNLFLRSFDHGANWKPRVKYTDEETADGPSLVEDVTGRVFIAWWNTDGGIYFSASKPD
ncbi:MAG: hypothetical protein H6P98_1408 [Candidatus Aminicenantes bacterium]|nr:hypothetical protein [Candidatus Aminicenantes bacterium]